MTTYSAFDEIAGLLSHIRKEYAHKRGGPGGAMLSSFYYWKFEELREQNPNIPCDDIIQATLEVLINKRNEDTTVYDYDSKASALSYEIGNAMISIIEKNADAIIRSCVAEPDLQEQMVNKLAASPFLSNILKEGAIDDKINALKDKARINRDKQGAPSNAPLILFLNSEDADTLETLLRQRPLVKAATAISGNIAVSEFIKDAKAQGKSNSEILEALGFKITKVKDVKDIYLE